jgi:hypothetical protein
MPADTANVDSRQYRFGFVADSPRDLPADFGGFATRSDFRSALFLPKDDAGWFDRPQYPPRIILLHDDGLEIRAHPSSGEKPAQISFHELSFVELGQFLLQGWIRFGAPGCERELQYNTRSRPSVRRFLRSLGSAFVRPDSRAVGGCANFGRPLDLKFGNAYAGELIPGEKVRAQFFRPSERKLLKFGPLKREISLPADFVAITDRRLLWLTDRHRDRYDPYGTIIRFAPFRTILALTCVRRQHGTNLEVLLKSGFEWRVPVPDEFEEEARAFSQTTDFVR